MDRGQPDSAKFTYCVIVTRPDKTRIVLEGGLTWRRAEELKQLLLDAKAFPAVEVEPEDPPG